jgi:hypothetical protein
VATIHLDTPLPGASSGLPAGSGEQPSNACAVAPPCDLLDLASGGVCQAIPVTRDAGALLPHRFTLTIAGGLFSVALSRESPRIAVSNHPALRSPDFPRLTSGSHPPSRPAVIRGRPANSFAQIKVLACAAHRPAPARPVQGDAHSGPSMNSVVDRQRCARMGLLSAFSLQTKGQFLSKATTPASGG